MFDVRSGGLVTGIGRKIPGFFQHHASTLDSLLYQTEAIDPFIYTGVVAVLGLVAMASAMIPALRATRVDPTRALSSE